MRILANYGFRTSGESFSVSFESMGDTKMEEADAAVDRLFSMARAAIERQLAPKTVKTGAPQLKDGNGGGNGKDRPPTEKQINLIDKFLYGLVPEAHSRMWKYVLGREIGSYADLDRKEASKVVDGIIHNRVQLRKVMLSA